MSRPSPLERSRPDVIYRDLPSVEDLSDCESTYSEDYYYGNTVSQPIRAFFLGCRQSLLITPRELEDGRNVYSESSTTLVSNSLRADVPPALKKQERNPLPPAAPPPDPNHGLGNSPLPLKRGDRVYRYLRWNFGSVYRRIFGLAFVGNITAFAILLIQNFARGQSLTYGVTSTAVAANILASIIVRNEHIVNALFLVFGTWPAHFPLSFRRLFAKVYSYGGIHSGCSVAATFWYIAFLVLLNKEYMTHDLTVLRGYVLLVSYAIILLLVSIIVFAYPRIRATIHNWFEGIHRFMGWSAVLLFWAQIMLLVADTAASTATPFGVALAANPSFWLLLMTTLLIIYPWTRLRLRDVEAEVLSDHCVKLNFNYANVQYGQAVRLSDAPLKETHSFAVIPKPSKPPTPKPTCHGCGRTTPCKNENGTRPGSSASLCRPERDGFSVLVSNAGDWTQKMIRNPPKKLYTRGTPQFGVLRVAGLFSPCIVMATGSGIGPCLSLFVQKPDHPVRIIWSAPNPVQTYGQEVIDLLYKADPRAVIIDTRKTGRPDLVGIAYRVWESSKWEGPNEFGLRQPYFPPPPGCTPPPPPTAAERAGSGTEKNAKASKKTRGPCEAVVIISNQKVTKKVVYGLESRGVPAYGAIFDS